MSFWMNLSDRSIVDDFQKLGIDKAHHGILAQMLL